MAVYVSYPGQSHDLAFRYRHGAKMIAAYGELRHEEIAVPGQQIVMCSCWQELVAAASRATAVVIRVSNLSAAVQQEIRQLQRAVPLIPVVLVIPDDRESTRHLACITVEGVVWDDEISRQLPGILERLICDANLIVRLIQTTKAAQAMAPHFRRAMLLSLEADPPYRTVKRWARDVGVSPRSIQAAWRRHFGAVAGPRQFLALIRSLRHSKKTIPDAALLQHLLQEIDRFGIGPGHFAAVGNEPPQPRQDVENSQ